MNQWWRSEERVGAERAAEWEEERKKERESGSTESVTQLSAGVIFN